MNLTQITNLYKQARFFKDDNDLENPQYLQIYTQLAQIVQFSAKEKQELTNEMEIELSPFTSRQLKTQLLAYKYFIRNLRLPRSVDQTLSKLSKTQNNQKKARKFIESHQTNKEKYEKNEMVKWIIQEKMSRASEQPDSSNSQNNHSNEQQTLRYFVEKTGFFVEKRKNEIYNYLQNGNLNEEQIVKLNCELKFLENKDFYLKVRNKILGDLKNGQEKGGFSRGFENNLLDRSMYRREKPMRKMEGKIAERFELQIKNDQDHRKRARHTEFITSLFKHQQEFYEFHRKKYRIAKKRIQHVKTHLDWLEKKEQDQKDKQEKERVRALKAQDFEAYVMLVQQTKNTRILELLNQTDSFLRQIGAKVRLQKGENPDNNADEELRNEKSGEEFVSYFKNSNKIYYNLTHSTREEIKEQPSLLEGGSLKSYQLIGLQWLVSLYNNKLNGVLADEMGLGKTIQTIALFCYLMENKKNYGPFLIVVPLTTLSNWVYEFDKWAPSIKKILYKGTPPHRKMLANSLKTAKWNVCITTYEYILKDRLVLNKFEWKYIIVDEGHRMKNSRSKFAQTLGQQYTSENRLLLTGTPLQNNLAELWSLLNFLLPKVFSSCDDFEKWFSMPLNKISSEKDVQLSEEEKLLIINRLHQVLRPFLLRRVKKEVEAEIPNKVEHVIKIELSPWQKIVYNQIKDNGVMARDPQTGKIGTKALMNMMMQLRKICNHPYLFLDPSEYLYNFDDNIYRVAGKFELLDRIIPKLIAARHRLLIFSQMTNLMDIMQLYFDFRKFKYLRLDGNTKADERGERMAMFNKENSEFDIFLLSTRAGGLGLNLQSADTVVLFDSDWNPQMDLQAQDRAHRIGQKSEVRVFRLVTNSWIEEEILSKAAFKMNLDEIFIQAGLFNQKSTDSERRERLEDLLKKKSVYEELDDEIPNDEQINEMLARNEDELNYYDQMDKERYEKEKLIFKKFKEPSKGDSKFVNYRLILEEEVPDWIKSTPKSEENTQEYGRGSRIRKQVSYVDDLTENQWLKLIEDGKELLENPEQDVRLTNLKRTYTHLNGENKQKKIKTNTNDDEFESDESDLGSRKIKKIKRSNNNTEKSILSNNIENGGNRNEEEIFVDEYV